MKYPKSGFLASLAHFFFSPARGCQVRESVTHSHSDLNVLPQCADKPLLKPHKKIGLCLKLFCFSVSPPWQDLPSHWVQMKSCTYRINRSSSLDAQSPFSSWEYSNICLHTHTHTHTLFQNSVALIYVTNLKKLQFK